jgi:multimeric flavodoxin WrbA
VFKQQLNTFLVAFRRVPKKRILNCSKDPLGKRADMVKFDDLNAVDLLCVGSPVHAWSVSKPVKEFLERLKSIKGLAGKKAFAFDTKFSEGKLAGSAGRKIEKELKDLGLVIAKPSESAIVKGWKGPLVENEEETLKL